MTSKKESEYRSDTATFESPDFLRHINKNREFYEFEEGCQYPKELTEHTLKYYNTTQKNYKKFYKDWRTKKRKVSQKELKNIYNKLH